MRFASLLLGAPLLAGCGVPEVAFVDADASDGAAANSGLEAGPGVDAGSALDAGSPLDAGSALDAFSALEAGPDAAGETDAGSDAQVDSGGAVYCMGPDGGVPPPNGLACCPGGTGEACAGQCLPKACKACQPCAWPSVCCTNGANGVCKPWC